MRVIGGKAKGHRLVAPKGRVVRPTIDRVREALFSIIGPDLLQQRVLDLYAGVGTLGIEALSRGAEHATFVERDPRAVEALTRNLKSVRFDELAEVFRVPVKDALRKLSARGCEYDLIFLDPPYRIRTLDLRDVLEALLTRGLVVSGGRIILEHSSARPPVEIEGLGIESQRVYGDTALVFYRPEGR